MKNNKINLRWMLLSACSLLVITPADSYAEEKSLKAGIAEFKLPELDLPNEKSGIQSKKEGGLGLPALPSVDDSEDKSDELPALDDEASNFEDTLEELTNLEGLPGTDEFSAPESDKSNKSVTPAKNFSQPSEQPYEDDEPSIEQEKATASLKEEAKKIPKPKKDGSPAGGSKKSQYSKPLVDYDFKVSGGSSLIAREYSNPDNSGMPRLRSYLDYASHFFVAAERGNINAMRALLYSGMDANSTNGAGESVLMHAVRVGNAASVRYLLASGGNPNFKDSSGKTSVHHASLANNPSMIAELVTAGGNVNEKDNEGKTPLMDASSFGFHQAMAALRDSGVDVKLSDNAGRSALHYAAASGDYKAAYFLINNGAIVDAKDSMGYTPLMIAAFNGKSACASFLIANGANVSSADNFGRKPIDFARISGDAQTITVLLGNSVRAGGFN
jgi:ankyrin repeat protein